MKIIRSKHTIFSTGKVRKYRPIHPPRFPWKDFQGLSKGITIKGFHIGQL